MDQSDKKAEHGNEQPVTSTAVHCGTLEMEAPAMELDSCAELMIAQIQDRWKY